MIILVNDEIIPGWTWNCMMGQFQVEDPSIARQYLQCSIGTLQSYQLFDMHIAHYK